MGGYVASKGGDDTVRLWSTDTASAWASSPESTSSMMAAWPCLPSTPAPPRHGRFGPRHAEDDCDRLIHIWELDLAVLLGQPAAPTITYTSAKVVLVGESNVGKSYLAHRIATGVAARGGHDQEHARHEVLAARARAALCNGKGAGKPAPRRGVVGHGRPGGIPADPPAFPARHHRGPRAARSHRAAPPPSRRWRRGTSIWTSNCAAAPPSSCSWAPSWINRPTRLTAKVWNACARSVALPASTRPAP